MQPKFKEEPKEWLKFTAVTALAAAVVSFLLHRKHLLDRPALWFVLAALALALVACWLRPRWFRGFYRAGMTVSFHVGQFMGRILLGVFFLFVLTPLGLLLRLTGKDLLNLRRNPSASTYWQPAKTTNNFDRQF